MQIDFHHGATYVIGRLAGFSDRDARVVAYCAQYVDDATNSGTIRFRNGAMFERISSAHKMLDYRNFKDLSNHRVWIPFHFLPGNASLPAGENPEGSFIHELICRPDSHVARDMVNDCILNRECEPYSLHRLGITMHVYADTWAHQGFAGVNHEVNEARDISGATGKSDSRFFDRVKTYFASAFVCEALPLGHGAVLSHPDLPFLKWGYTNGFGERIERDNPRDFLEAADRMCVAMQRYRAGDPDAEAPGLPPDDRKKIGKMLRTIRDKDGEARHLVWCDAIASGEFSFGPVVPPEYVPKGKGSWKHRSIGTNKSVDDFDDCFTFRKKFVKSHWKLFHDALQSHRFRLVHIVLPRYGICAA